MKVSTLMAGFVIGLWIGIAQAWIRLYPPEVWGFCMIGHPNDLFTWIINRSFNTDFLVHAPSIEFPILTFVGVLIGSAMAAIRNRETKLGERLRDPIQAFMIGFVIAIFGLLIGACPIKITASAAYGYSPFVIGLFSMIAGVILACKYMRWRLRK